MIEYVINVIFGNTKKANEIEITLDAIIEKRTVYEQLYIEYKAINMYNKGNFKTAIDLLESAIGISNYNKNSAMINYHLSILYHGCAQYEESRKYIQKAKELFVEGCSYKRVLNCDIQMANYYIRVKRYDLAIELLKSCIETTQYLKVNNSTRALMLRNTAWTYILLNEYENSLVILDEAAKLEQKNGNLILYKIWCNYRLGKFNSARTIIDENGWLYDNNDYKERLKLFELLVNQENQRATKKIINQAKKVYEDLASRQRYGNMYFYLDILIELLESAKDKDELIHYLKIKSRLGK